jgi:hypothetical protein
MAAKNKCLAQSNKSGTVRKATKEQSNPATGFDLQMEQPGKE